MTLCFFLSFVLSCFWLVISVLREKTELDGENNFGFNNSFFPYALSLGDMHMIYYDQCLFYYNIPFVFSFLPFVLKKINC